jgi:hypothetical protein
VALGNFKIKFHFQIISKSVKTNRFVICLFFDNSLRALQDASNAVGYLALILLHHMKLRK